MITYQGIEPKRSDDEQEWREKRNALLQKFTDDFRLAYNYSAYNRAAFDSILFGKSPYIVIEALIKVIKDQNEFIKLNLL